MTLAAIPLTHKYIRPSHASPKVATKPVSQATFEAWLTRRGDVTQRSASAYASDIRQMIRWYERTVGPYRPENLTMHDLRAWRDQTIDPDQEGRSPATWNRRKASVSVYQQYLRDQRINSPAALESAPKLKAVEEHGKAPRWLTAGEVAKLMRGLELMETRANTERRKAIARRDVAMVSLMMLAGLREMEVTALRLMDVSISERKGELTIRGKRQVVRHVPMSAELRHHVTAYLAVETFKPLDRIFAITTRQVQERVTGIGRACGIDNLTPHRFRHVSVKRMLRAGVDMETVREYHGHRSINTTLRYAAVSWDELEDAAERGANASLPKGRD